jgi:TPR repeat protein
MPSVDAAQAVVWLRRAAKAGHVAAQRILAGCYRDGTGVAKDSVEAAIWLRRAALTGQSERIGV